MRKAFLFIICCISLSISRAQSDTLRIMGYNVLYYGNGCQGPTYLFHDYLSTIVGYANPDILSLEKMASVPVTRNDKYGTAPYGFADSVVKYALDKAYPGRYAHCPFTNEAHNTNMSVIFYDQRKLGFVAIVSSYVNVTDFNIYKLYYKDPNLARTHDTTFLYIMPNHDMSGDENEKVRGQQIAGVMQRIKMHFSALPNMIDLGDFNVRNSDEPFYQTLTNNSDTAFRFYDAPFYPDRKLKYPANWDHDPKYTMYFTTSTRASANIPNSCGTGGGAKNWYDHIFFSSRIANGTDHIRYIPNSYKTIGNDGGHFRQSINDKTSHVNSAAPPDVIEALYQMSNKYPVMISLEVTGSNGERALQNTEIKGIADAAQDAVTIAPVADGHIDIHFPQDMIGQDVTIELMDKAGNSVMSKTKKVEGTELSIKCKVGAGAYKVKLTGHHNIITTADITVK